MAAAQEALDRLREGNNRFVSTTSRVGSPGNQQRRVDLAKGQHPFAIILGCSDSRVPPEIVFDQGLGDLFVIRVAGNIVTPTQLGSVEFAAAQFGTRLVVVLGHSQCGAILATLESLQGAPAVLSPGLRSIVDRIQISVEGLVRSELRGDLDALAQRAVRNNIDNSVSDLRHGSTALAQLIRNDGLVVIGAQYALETGAVEFFDDEGLR